MKQNWIVYKHTNKQNHKSYIGITGQEPEKRWKNGRGYQHHKKFFAAIIKYGWDGFTHDILATNLSEEEARKLEKEYIIKYNSKNNGYNLTDGGEGASGYSHSSETKKAISKSMKQHRKMCKGYQRKVQCINTGQIFTSIKEAGEWANVSSSNISACARGKLKTSGKHPVTKERLSWRYF